MLVNVKKSFSTKYSTFEIKKNNNKKILRLMRKTNNSRHKRKTTQHTCTYLHIMENIR